LICASDEIVLVIEVKSTFLRRSQRDAWLHGKTTLRRAGRQLRRKVGAIRQALNADAELVKALGLGSPNASVKIHGWIADKGESYVWDKPRFDDATNRRRLRILNSLFLMLSMGGLPSITY
jgi:hypothetical protein